MYTLAAEVFRVAGGDIECEPNPTPERALEVLHDLRKCYNELLIGVSRDDAEQAIGEVVPMPGTAGFGMAAFKAEHVPVGTKLYAAPVAAAPGIDHLRSVINALSRNISGAYETACQNGDERMQTVQNARQSLLNTIREALPQSDASPKGSSDA